MGHIWSQGIHSEMFPSNVNADCKWLTQGYAFPENHRGQQTFEPQGCANPCWCHICQVPLNA